MTVHDPAHLDEINSLLNAIEARKKQNELAPAGPIIDLARYMFPEREGMNMIVAPHHQVIGHTLDRVLRMEIPRLIITVPPGYTKTELAVVNFMAKGMQLNPKSRFIHATYSSDLARENSDKIKTMIELEDFQSLKQIGIAQDTRAKDRWKTTEGGGMLAKAAGGPITGFRAGYMDKTRFTGALVVDDPLKPDDAFSPAKRLNVNRRATNTFRSRIAHEGVPIIVIMQRLHDDDFVGHLLRGGSGDYWHHLDLPVWIEEKPEPYPEQWTHGIPIQHDLPPGPLWAEKHDEAEIEILKQDDYTYLSQYKQRPKSVEGVLFDMDKFGEYSELPPIEWCCIYGDTAQKTAERNDFSVLELWGKAERGIYLMDLLRGKWEAPALEANALAFWEKHKGLRPRGFKVEDASSGTGLIQSLKKKLIPISGVTRQKDKYTRGLDAAPWVSNGMVWLPKNAVYTRDLKIELSQFDGLGSGHDDQVDPMMDAISEMLAGIGVGQAAMLLTRNNR